MDSSKIAMDYYSYLFELAEGTSYTTMVAYFVTAVAVSFSLYAYSVFQLWEKDFSGHKLDRTNESCPSNKQPPKVET